MITSFTDSLPGALVTHITAICGKDGEEWFERLPAIIEELEARWSVSVQGPFPGIEFNFVAPAVCDNGGHAVVKISPPYERIEIFNEAKYLRTRDGDGAVKLRAVDHGNSAILIERAFPGTALFREFEGNPVECVKPAIDVLRSILRPAPVDIIDVGTLDGWFNNFRRHRETDFPADHAEKAFEIYERLSGQPGRSFYLHGDFHPGNIVTSDRTPFLAIDPKGIVGNLGYDIAVFLNNLDWWQRQKSDAAGFLDNALGQFADAFEFEEFELREWAYAYMVIGAWWNFEDMPEHYDGEVAMTDIWRV